MADKTYGLMNWRNVEGILYADVDNPHSFMGLSKVKGGTLIQAFVPDAISAKAIFDDGSSYDLSLEDEMGFYALYVKLNLTGLYRIYAEYANGSTYEYYDSYQFAPQYPKKLITKFISGEYSEAYGYFGAHREVVDEIEGTRFAYYNPDATRVSVIGDFNFHDGRRHIMNKDNASGIFEIFIPDVREDFTYMYEIRNARGDVTVVSDPYATKHEDGLCVVHDDNDYVWKDQAYKLARKQNNKSNYMNILSIDEFGSDHVLYAVNNNYNFVLFTDELFDNYAPNPELIDIDIKEVIENYHKNNIGVLVEWPVDGLTNNFSNNAVCNYYLSMAVYYAYTYHIDGLVMTNVTSIMYLDYDKKPGEYVPNIYGGVENLEGLDFLRRLNKKMNKKFSGYTMIAVDTSLMPGVTGNDTEDSLGFSYKMNKGYNEIFNEFFSIDGENRGNYYNKLTSTLVYAYNERFILEYNRDYLSSISEKSCGDEDKRVAYGYYMTYPGSKLVTYSCDEGNAEDSSFSKYVENINNLYKNNVDLYELDDTDEGFEWIENMDTENLIVAYVRRGKVEDHGILCVCNMGRRNYSSLGIGVPVSGKYKEIINSDNVMYGGNGCTNPRVKTSKAITCNGRDNMITIKLGALSFSMFKY